MLKPVTADSRAEFLENSHYPLIRDSYLISIENIVSTINLTHLEELINKGDIQAAFKALNIDSVSFRPYEIAFSNAFEQSANTETLAMPRFEDSTGRQIVFRYDIRNIESDRWLKEYLGYFITSITSEQKEVISNHITRGLIDGKSKKSIALDIAGRINPESKMREGGIIGLSVQQELFVSNARKELLSGKIPDMSNYLTRSLRDRRFDSIVKTALAEGRSLSTETVDKLTRSYSNRLLMFRAGLISQIETSVALNQGKMDSYIQAIKSGSIKVEQIEKTWHSMRDRNVRASHRTLDRQTIPFYSKFQTARGSLLLYPKDPLAPIEERGGCRCRMFIRVNGVLR